MGRDLVEPDWPPLTDAEVGAVLARYGWTAGQAAVRWRSPRPMSAAALVDGDGQEVFVKRHHALVRTAAQLGAEHALAGHLRALGVAVPAVLRLPGGGSTVRVGDYLYEVQARATGIDLYRDVLSWSPFTSLHHARAAGAAGGGGGAGRPPGARGGGAGGRGAPPPPPRRGPSRRCRPSCPWARPFRRSCGPSGEWRYPG